MERIFRVLTRKKELDPVALTDTRLARVLNVYDLTALGVGSTLGVGVYVLAGQVAKDTAGPSVVLSFFIAAVASVFAGLCYAEFGSRVPRAGSAYIYSYVTVGELIAFIIGWNLILEYVIGSASVARGLSHYLDSLINNTMENTFREIAPINISFMSQYFDFFSFGLSVILATALAFGMKESSRINNVFTILNILVIFFIVVAGSFKANPENWSLPAPSNTTQGTGGFFPFGVAGMIKGAATCFYGFVGFDCIATTGEEVKNPQRAIPISIMVSLMVVFLAYFSTSTVVTLMVPYYLQDPVAPIPHAFDIMGWNVAKWIVSIGAIFGLCASLFGAMFPLPRIIYAMATDGVIFKFLGQVSERFHTPLIGTLLAGLLTGLMSSLFDLSQLVNMMSIGTLLAYTIVAVCVLSLRYSEDEEVGNVINSNSSTELIGSHEKVTFIKFLKQTFNFTKSHIPNQTSQFVVNFAISIYVLLCLALGLCITYLQDELKHAKIWSIIVISIIGVLLILVIMSIATQPNSRKDIKFMVPFVPLIPALSILINIYLMIMLDVNTWIRFGVWMAIGLPMYFILIRKCTHNISNKMHAKSNGVKTNGHIYTGGQDCTDNNDISNTLTPSLALTCTVNDSLCSSVDVDNALAALDEMLSKEEAIALESACSRRVSLDTVSNVSKDHCEESIIALVHNEDKVNLSLELKPETSIVKDNSDCTISNEPSFVIPPPPPMQDFEMFKAPSSTFRHLSQDDTLHKTPNLPLQIRRSLSQPEIIINCSSSDQNSDDSSIEDVDDNIAFGSPQHKKLIGNLSKLFEQQYIGANEIKLTKPVLYRGESTILQEPTQAKLNPNISDTVIQPRLSADADENVTPTNIKQKLNEIFRSALSSKLSHLDKLNTDLIKPAVDVVETATDTPNAPLQEEVSIELSNAAILKSNGYVHLDNNANTNIQEDIDIHKSLMHNTLKSIKLRKVNIIDM